MSKGKNCLLSFSLNREGVSLSRWVYDPLGYGHNSNREVKVFFLPLRTKLVLVVNLGCGYELNELEDVNDETRDCYDMLLVGVEFVRV
ncbi:hypothetical protein O6P43_017102 [Quillaja saponaria]|uniref:Uncharacterized protein n=1 Tax=Quillaja saponaria TaxID=32244 RepID=A0AAD7PN02_QUISA|nr:hypothetical protein O6P43_017102 [Quillaja saponaria]